ncbi:hypothetical protein IFM89_009498 [Coptis chinensis]|uniref:COP1-interacting protein 7 n=1 Tax=Coptis chinensis TaxID=261450 RepID=A0A835H206_9MAGN|nr:hypothetical protein IFM89_009498 [Coptis chinensis]
MEGGLSADVLLEYASFRILPTQNRFEASVCYNNKVEKLASGLLEQLVLQLPQVKGFHPKELGDCFKLQLPENLKGSTWFSKSTLLSFLHIVGVPELLKKANAIGDEISQLEEARKFHLALYTQGHQVEAQSKEAGVFFITYYLRGEMLHSITACSSNTLAWGSSFVAYYILATNNELIFWSELQITSADATKNELLRAMDFRLAALRDELVGAFNQVSDGAFSYNQITNLVSFSQFFGAVDLRNSLSKYLELSHKNQDAYPQNVEMKFSQDLGNENLKLNEGTAQACLPVVKPISYGASPAKAAQAERQSSTESENSCNSSSEDQPYIERSRSLIRSASPRRSASPMRRIQIGKSGSRRATALTIKSLSFIPARERISSNEDPAECSSDEGSARPFKKPLSNASSMSVKDAISLFEKKQSDQRPDLQKKRFPADNSVSTNKSVLRRWSAGMGDSSTQCPPESSSENAREMSNNDIVGGEIQNTPVKVKQDCDSTGESTNVAKTADESASLTAGEEKTSYSMGNLSDSGSAQAVDTTNRVTVSADWTRQKEDELNLMMMKMMESKPVRNRSTATGVSKSQELHSGQRGGFYDHYKKKRDEKLRIENSGKRVEKEEKFKTLQGILDQRKVEVASKKVGIAGKQDSIGRPKKPQKNPSPPLQPKKESSRNSSPLMQPKKDISRPAAPKKSSPKASPLPATRKSWPSAPSPKISSITPNKISSVVSSSGTTPTRRKSKPTPSPIQSNPKVERSQLKHKGDKGTTTETKLVLKGVEGKKQRAVGRSGDVSEAKALHASGDSSGAILAKPSFYNKVTKKGSVVPLETKPFLRKKSGNVPGAIPVKTKVSQIDESLNCENLIQPEEAVTETSKPASEKQEGDSVLPRDNVTNLEAEDPVISNQENEHIENDDQFVSESDNSFKKTVEFPVEIQPEIELSISPTAWVEIEEHEELPVSNDSRSHNASPINVEPVALSSPRVRHSLSQMLQEDSGEPEIIEWGNAENPPAMVYQKDVAKGLKRLLKFARKSKGEANATGWSSPSVFSDGEEDAEESKASSKRHADAILRKSSHQAKGFGHLKASLGASYDGGNSSKNTDSTAVHDLHSGQTNTRKFSIQGSEKLPEGHISNAASSTKATRSFFSLSTFRSSKSQETKLR